MKEERYIEAVEEMESELQRQMQRRCVCVRESVCVCVCVCVLSRRWSLSFRNRWSAGVCACG